MTPWDLLRPILWYISSKLSSDGNTYEWGLIDMNFENSSIVYLIGTICELSGNTLVSSNILI